MVWKRDNVIVDITGWTARMEIRDKIGGILLYRLDTSNGRLTINGPIGMIGLNIPADVSSAWTWKSGVYDLELVDPNGKIGRMIQGKIKVNAEVTTGA